MPSWRAQSRPDGFFPRAVNHRNTYLRIMRDSSLLRHGRYYAHLHLKLAAWNREPSVNILNRVQQWREQRDAIPTEKIKVLGLIRPMGSVRRTPPDAHNCPPEIRPIEPPPEERAEPRMNISGTAMLIGRHGKLGVEKAT